MPKVTKPKRGYKGRKPKKRSTPNTKRARKGVDDGLIATILASIVSRGGRFVIDEPGMSTGVRGQYGGMLERKTGASGGLASSGVFQQGQYPNYPTTPESGPGPRPVFSPNPQLPPLEALAAEQRDRIGQIGGGPDVQANVGGIKNLTNQLSQ